jgi:transposase
MEKERTRGYQSNWKRNRYFSESIRKKCVRDIELNRATVLEISRQYEVSTTAVYNWIGKYSAHLKRGVKQVQEPMSDTKKIKELKERIKELEHMVGQKQIKVEFYEKMIELTEQELDIDIKKKGSSERSGGSGRTGKRRG